MLKTAATVFLGLALSSAVLAQQQPRTPRPARPPKAQKSPKQAPIQNPELTVARIQKALRLNDDQVFQVRTMVNNRNLEITRAYQDGGPATSRRLTLDSIQHRFQSEVRTLLTPAQIDRFDRALLRNPGAFH